MPHERSTALGPFSAALPVPAFGSEVSPTIDSHHRAALFVSFDHRYIAEKPTWIATIPVGHTDGYPSGAAGNAGILIGGVIYPILPGGVNANLTMVELGEQESVSVGDSATLVGTGHPDITPQAVAESAGFDSDQWIMTKLNPLLHRKVA